MSKSHSLTRELRSSLPLVSGMLGAFLFTAPAMADSGAAPEAPQATKPVASTLKVAPAGTSQASSAAKSSAKPSAPAAVAATPSAEAPEPAAAKAPDEATVAEARNRFDRGVELYADGDFELALIEFKRAHELVSNYRVLYNIGQVSVQLRQYARARAALESYLKQGGSEIPAERLAEVSADIEMLKTRTAYITVTAKLSGAQVLLDGVPAGVTPLAEPILVDAGEHRLEVRKSGFKPSERFLTLAGSDDQTVAFELSEVVEPTRTVERQTIVVNKPESDSTWTWIGFGSAGLLAAGAVATGVLGLTAASDLEDLRNTPDVSREELDSAKSRGGRMFLASDILAGAAVVVGGTTLFFVLTGDDASENPAKAPLKVGVAPNKLTLSGSF